MDHAGLVVEDLAAAIAFFVELGLELEGEATVEGEFADQLIGVDGVRADIAMLRTPDGHSRVEVSTFREPVATSGVTTAPVNTPGIPRLTFVIARSAGGLPEPASRRDGAAARADLRADRAGAYSFTGMAFDDIRHRAAGTLLALAEEFGEPVPGGTRIRLELSQRTLAALVAASRENVNRALAPLIADGAISQSDAHFVIHDRDALAAAGEEAL